MRPVTFYGFAALTAVTVVAAAVAVSMQTETTLLTPGTEPAFPKLAANVNDVARVEVTNAKGAFTIARNGDKWGLVEKDSYPVEFEKIKSAIVGVANFKLIEQKTSDPDRYARLQLEAPNSPEAKSTRLVFKTAKGDVIATAIIGRQNPNLFGQGGAGTYIRRGDEKATWLVRGDVTLGEEPNNWMARQIANYGQEDIRRVTIRHPDGAEFAISKAKKEDKNFVVENIPEGRKMKNADEANPLGGVMWRMMFDDVKLASKQKWPEKPYVAHYTAWDGFTVRIETAKFGEDYWGRFRASVADGVTDEDAKKKAQKIADEINERTKNWTYMLTAGDSEKLTMKVEELLDKPKGS